MCNSFIILTELGYGIGLGHYTRCNVLYESLLENNEKGQMYINQVKDSDNYPNSISQNWVENLQFLSFFNDNIKIIIDSYLLNSKILRSISNKFKNIIIIDDYNRMNYGNVKLIINPNIYFSRINYSNQFVNVFGGSEYVILRKLFTELSQYKPKNNKILKILLTLGGSDYRNITATLIEIILKNTEHHLVVISTSSNIKTITCNRLTVLDYLKENEMYAEMVNCDIAVSACGQTLHELASIGVPTIGIKIDFDQDYNQEFYYNEQILQSLISWDDKDLKKKILLDIYKYEYYQTRIEISKKSQNLIGKNGPKNIIKLIKTIQ